MAEPRMLTTGELAARLSVSPATIRSMCNTGKWPHARIGRLYRFSEEHYQAIISTPKPPEPWTKERQRIVADALRELEGRT